MVDKGKKQMCSQLILPFLAKQPQTESECVTQDVRSVVHTDMQIPELLPSPAVCSFSSHSCSDPALSDFSASGPEWSVVWWWAEVQGSFQPRSPTGLSLSIQHWWRAKKTLSRLLVQKLPMAYLQSVRQWWLLYFLPCLFALLIVSYVIENCCVSTILSQIQLYNGYIIYMQIPELLPSPAVCSI